MKPAYKTAKASPLSLDFCSRRSRLQMPRSAVSSGTCLWEKSDHLFCMSPETASQIFPGRVVCVTITRSGEKPFCFFFTSAEELGRFLGWREPSPLFLLPFLYSGKFLQKFFVSEVIPSLKKRADLALEPPFTCCLQQKQSRNA